MKDSKSLKNWLMSGKEELHFEIICKCILIANLKQKVSTKYLIQLKCLF